MDTYSDRTVRTASGSSSAEAQAQRDGRLATLHPLDHRQQTPAQRKLADLVAHSPKTRHQRALQAMADGSLRSMAAMPVQALADRRAMRSPGGVAANHDSGLPGALKRGIEHLSGLSMDSVKVHYGSDKPAQMQALAYAQGTDIHVGPGQEQHLPHEAWHVVQQAQGRVAPTTSVNDGIPVNDDKALEHEADVMGAKAVQMRVPVDAPMSTPGVGTHAASTTAATSPSAPGHVTDIPSITGLAPVQGVFANGTYRLTTGQTRAIHVEPGTFATTNPAPATLTRAVLFETMVRRSDAAALATRFTQAAAGFPVGGARSVGLSIAINESYRHAGDIAAAQGRLTATANAIRRAAQPPVNVVSVLWQDGRANPATSIRPEVPFAELRKHAATDPGATNLYAELATQAGTVWRKMGDDDLPFDDPNGDSEVNSELERLEARNDSEGDRGNLTSFSYTLTPTSQDPAIIQWCADIYRDEAATIAEVVGHVGIRVYAIEPTTYYRASYNRDAGGAWNDYETHANAGSKQIKEGASFSKSLLQSEGIKPEYIELNEPIPTADGGRLNALVAILEQALDPHTATSDSALVEQLDIALQAVDQSIWDLETLTRGSAWMYRASDGVQITPEVEAEVNQIIRKRYAALLGRLSRQVMAEYNSRKRALHP